MGLNIKAGITGGSPMQYKKMEPAAYPARLVQVIDLGLQPDPFEEDGKPLPRILFTYEFADEFMLDEDGQELPDKPRWLSEEMVFYGPTSTKAKIAERYTAFDPTNSFDGDFEKCLGAPVMVTIVHNPGKGKNAGEVYEKVGGVGAMREKQAKSLPPLVNTPRVFDLSNPDMEVFLALPSFIQEKIKGNLEFEGSPLQKLLGGKHPTTPPKQKKLAEELDDDIPY